jgi:glycosyltransferase involved in cell wall biosynthesis
MGIDVELATMERPDVALIRDAFGKNATLDIKKIRILDLFGKNEEAGYDLTINTHGDMLLYFKENFTKKNSIVYCHYPIASYLTDRGDSAFPEIIQKRCQSALKSANMHFSNAENLGRKMMQNSMVLTNSEFSRRAIFKGFGVDSLVLPPPVDADTFRNAALSSDAREESILVVSRFHQSKKLENAIRLAKLLKQNGIGKHLKIAGNMSRADAAYFSYLNNLVKQQGLEDFVRFEADTNFDRLLDLMRQAKVYFHSMPGEPFGISTVEAMSAGLIPVVPDVGGHTEFVPGKYQFHTLKQAAAAVATALHAPASERLQISRSTQKYSTANYVKKFQQIVSEVLEISKPLQGTANPARDGNRSRKLSSADNFTASSAT